MRRWWWLCLACLLFAAPLRADTFFSDDFNDLNYTGWTFTKGAWDASTGALSGTFTKKADIISSFPGCVACTFEADVRIQSPGGRAALLAWYTSKAEYVEVRLMSDKQKILLKHHTSSGTEVKKSMPFTVSAGTTYHVQVSYLAGQFQVSIDGNPLITVTASSLPFGTAGLRVASTTGSAATSFFDNVAVTGDPTPSATVNDYVYQLQNYDSDDLTAIGATRFDLAVIDYSRTGSEGTGERFTPAEITALKNSPGGPKIVLAYMSIGEAEDYRWYWQNSWDANHDGVPDPGAPAWLSKSNPDWPGNYEVRYWDPNWQSIIYGSPSSYLDKIIDTGFDGVYLDIVDAFEYWGPGGPSGEDRITAEQDMVDFVEALANYARVTRGVSNFLVFPQNGEALSSHPDYVNTVSGIGKEDTWYNGNHPQPSRYTQDVITKLNVFRNAGKLVLVVDYVTQQSLIDDFYSKASALGFVPYATVRNLDRITINPGHEPD